MHAARPSVRPSVRSGAAALLLCAGLLLTGCTSAPDPDPVDVLDVLPSEVPLPDAAAFAAGTCARVAPAVVEVGRAIPALGPGGQVEAEVKTALRTAQRTISDTADRAEPALQPALAELVEKLAIVRIRADANSYETRQGELLQTAYDAVVATCTGTAPPSPAAPSAAPPAASPAPSAS